MIEHRNAPVPPEVLFGDLARRYRARRAAIDDALRGVLEGGWYILGTELSSFEREFAAYCGAPYAVGCANGTDAIALALRANGIGAGDEVITTAFTAAFTALGILQSGATPVFADIDPDTLNMRPGAAAAAIGPRTAALMPVHLYGGPADMPAFRQLADRHGLLLVEDAAQAHGATVGEARVGSLGDVASFSFYPTKNLGALGDAGAAVFRDSAAAERARMLRDGGQSARYVHDVPGGANSRLDELQAAVLRIRLRYLDEENARRRSIAARYHEALNPAEGLQVVGGLPNTVHARHLFVVRTARRSEAAAALLAAGVHTAVHYPTPLHRQPAFAAFSTRADCTVADEAAASVLSIPLYPELSDADVDHVVRALGDLTREWAA